MISFSNDPAVDERGDCDRLECDRAVGVCREGAGEPRAVGQLMAAVLARYGISANAEPERPRLPRLEHQPTQLDGLVSVG